MKGRSSIAVTHDSARVNKISVDVNKAPEEVARPFFIADKHFVLEPFVQNIMATLNLMKEGI